MGSVFKVVCCVMMLFALLCHLRESVCLNLYFVLCCLYFRSVGLKVFVCFVYVCIGSWIFASCSLDVHSVTSLLYSLWDVEYLFCASLVKSTPYHHVGKHPEAKIVS